MFDFELEEFETSMGCYASKSLEEPPVRLPEDYSGKRQSRKRVRSNSDGSRKESKINSDSSPESTSGSSKSRSRSRSASPYSPYEGSCESNNESVHNSSCSSPATSRSFKNATTKRRNYKNTDSSTVKSKTTEVEGHVPTRPRGEVEVSDFDQMLQRRRQEMKKRHGRTDIQLINDNDDKIDHLISIMKSAVEEDRKLITKGQPATKKISILKFVMSQLIKKKLQLAFVEHNILDVLADWISPVKDNVLPCFLLRESILKLLSTFVPIEPSYIQESRIADAIMYLHKHKHETRENQKIAGDLIAEWSRPIFNLSSDFSSMSKEERRERDLALQPPKRPKPIDTQNKSYLLYQSFDNEDIAIRPGDEGWVPRARVPMTSNKTYVVRPSSAIETENFDLKKSRMNRYEEQMKKFGTRNRLKGSYRISALSINGCKMPL